MVIPPLGDFTTGQQWNHFKGSGGNEEKTCFPEFRVKIGFDFAISLQYANSLCEIICKLQINSITFSSYISFQLILLPVRKVLSFSSLWLHCLLWSTFAMLHMLGWTRSLCHTGLRQRCDLDPWNKVSHIL